MRFSQIKEGWLGAVAAVNRFGLVRKVCSKSWTGLEALKQQVHVVVSKQQACGQSKELLQVYNRKYIGW
jgi:hypothetical protein